MTQNASCDSKKITKEIRFAVVMYGGVSLAIYMNGIAQEILNMVKATSDRSQEKMDQKSSAKTEGTASVYKELAEYLSKQVTPQFDHKFVVDIISGTSAGGINGVCLAKGLVCGLDDLKVLEKIWLDEGDIDKLLNDRGSEPDFFCSKEPKTSLFNSQRMFAKLLEAFKNMEKAAPRDNDAAHVKSLDLFVTTTDLRGLQLPIQLSDGKAFEHIYKHVFPFKYRFEEKADESTSQKQPNHFTGEYDPLLAFASRCTSSFPTAFEPVKIADVAAYLKKRSHEDHKNFSTNWDQWKDEFFKGYNTHSDDISLEDREFADGGYLDNRPFGHAIQAIHERESDCPLERKLLFIDPAPESDDKNKAKKQGKEISFLENTTLATISLPGYETIREEINALQKRNRWLRSVNRILETLEPINQKRLTNIFLKQYLYYTKKKLGAKNSAQPQTLHEAEQSKLKKEIRQDIESLYQGTKFFVSEGKKEPLPFLNPDTGFFKLVSNIINRDNKTSQEYDDSFLKILVQPQKRNEFDKNIFESFEKKDLNEMVELYGDGYPSYHYTKIDKITDFLARIISRASDIKEQSREYQVIRLLLETWRQKNFLPQRDQGKKTENKFIESYDIDFRIRRLIYFRNLLEKTLMQGIDLDEKPFHSEGQNSAKNLYNIILNALKRLYKLKTALLFYRNDNPVNRHTIVLKECLQDKKNTLDAALVHSSQNNSTKSALPDFETIVESLFPIGKRDSFIREFELLMKAISKSVHYGISAQDASNPQAPSPELYSSGTVSVRNDIENAISKLADVNLITAAQLLFLYDYGYDLHDLTTFQLFAGGEYGEGTPVDIHRISPLDATNLWNETKKEKSKLAGIALGAFGGFLDREWRRNDIMWGRLDGAERLIAAILPEEQHVLKRQGLIDKAHHAILRESIDEWLDELQCSRLTSRRAQEHYKRLQTIREALEKPTGEKTSSSAESKRNTEHPPAVSWNCFKQRSLDRAETLIKRVCPGFSFRNMGIAKTGQTTPAEQQPGPQWKKEFRSTYDFHREFEPEPSLRYLGRVSGIASSMIDRLEEGEGITKKISSYLKKLNAILLGLLDFSTPKTFTGVLFGYWVQLLFLVSIVLVAAGYFFISNELGASLRNLGILLLSIDIIAWAIMRLFETNIHKITCNTCFRRLLLSGAIILTALLLFGLIVLYDTIVTNGHELMQAFWKAYVTSLKNITAPFF